jgi:hypothetical protein
MQISIAIKSSHRTHDRRQAIYDTWLPEVPQAVDFFFILGNPRLVVMDTLACDVSDRFEDIAPKILYACMSMQDHGVDYGYFCDDDTYLRPDRLLAAIPRGHDYVGFVRPYGCDVHTKGVPYVQGSSFWLSRKAIDFVVQAGEKIMRPGIPDDCALGLALDGKVPLTHDRRYWPGPDPFVCKPTPDNNIISTHKALPEQMNYLHQPWRKRGNV